MDDDREGLAHKEAQIARLEAFLRISRLMNAESDPAILIQQISEEVKGQLDADRCTVFFHDAESNELYSYIASGLEIDEIRIPEGQGLAGAVFQSGETICLKDAYTDKRFNPQIDNLTGYRTTSVIALPIINRKGVRIGVAQTLNKNSGVFEKNDVDFLGELMDQASDLLDLVLRKEALAKQHATLQEAVSHLKVYDYLIGEKTPMKTLMRHSRRLHVWISIIGAVFMLLYAVTGIVLPHAPPHLQSVIYQLHSGKIVLREWYFAYSALIGASLALVTLTGILLWAYPRIAKRLRKKLSSSH